MECSLTERRAAFARGIGAGTSHWSANAHGRARDRTIQRLDETLIYWGRKLVEWNLFPCERRANRRLHTLAEKGVIRRAGQYVFDRGHPTQLYGPPIRPGMVAHEVTITEVLDAYRPAQFTVGADCRHRADLQFRYDGDDYFVEVDEGNNNRVRQTDRFRQYEGCTGYVLFLTRTRRRIETVRRWAAHVGCVTDIIFFGITADVLDEPFGAVFQNLSGEPGWVGRNDPPLSRRCGSPTRPTEAI